ncbi:MAG: Zn-dependent protease with chaperone function [Bacteroidetes bacterium]|nr:Zn-dependent protease with chaperone function [Bacteroidota bacterium]
MRSFRVMIVVAVVAGVLGLSCATVPVSGRSQLSLISSSEMMSMSYQIQKAVEQYMAQNNLADALKGYQWEFNVVESEEVNAWCMPGGKVVVYTGILPVTKDETGLAVVMGHEIAHAIAEHGRERMSQQMLAELGAAALDVALAKNSDETRALWMSAYGVGAQYGALLPFSREHESEADHLGLVFMAMAGYDPNAAVSFWERMAAASGGGKPPEFMSTHPSDETRIRQIKENLPEAMKYYKK